MLALAGFLSFLSTTWPPSHILAHIELAPQLTLSIHLKRCRNNLRVIWPKCNPHRCRTVVRQKQQAWATPLACAVQLAVRAGVNLVVRVIQRLPQIAEHLVKGGDDLFHQLYAVGSVDAVNNGIGIA